MTDYITEEKNTLNLTNRIPNKGLVMTLWHDDPEMIEAFKHECYTTLPKATGWFHQCNSNEYQMFEFWTGYPKLGLVREACQKVAEAIGMTLNEAIDESIMFKG